LVRVRECNHLIWWKCSETFRCKRGAQRTEETDNMLKTTSYTWGLPKHTGLLQWDRL
jgi:hypothetical protein